MRELHVSNVTIAVANEPAFVELMDYRMFFFTRHCQLEATGAQ